MSFYKFLELKENLVLYWKSADYVQKAIFSKICVLNLTLKGQKVAQISFKKPFLDNEEGCLGPIGALDVPRLEPNFEALWDWLQCSQNAKNKAEISDMIERCKPAQPLDYPIILDIEKISGTRVY